MQGPDVATTDEPYSYMRSTAHLLGDQRAVNHSGALDAKACDLSLEIGSLLVYAPFQYALRV